MEITDKYLLLSCLQKSIRRGLIDKAEYYGDLLWKNAKSHLLYRMSIIALEDIGIANIDLIHGFLTSGIKVKEIQARGGEEYIKKIIREFAESAKDRTACDVSYYALNQKINIEEGHKEIFNSESRNYFAQVGWLYYLLSPKSVEYKNIRKLEIPKEESLNNLKMVFPEIDQKIIDIVSFTMDFHREAHFLGLPLCYYHFNNKKDFILNAKIKTGDIITHTTHEKYYNNIISCGVDGHTRPGATAINKFLSQNNEIKKYFKENNVNYEERFGLVKKGLFLMEGGVVNKRLYYPMASHIYKYPFGQEHIQNINNILTNNIDEFNSLREKEIDNLSNENQTKTSLIAK